MALTRSTIVDKTKNLIYNTGLGEKPTIRNTSGNSSVSGDTVTFTVDDGALVRKGQVLSSYGATDTTDAYGFYVLDISTNTVTAVNGYNGAAIPDATAVGLLEHQAPATEFEIHSAIDEIVAGYLYPEVFDLIEDSLTVNLATLQSNADSKDEKIHRAWQQLGGIYYQVPAKLVSNVHTSMFSSGKLITYDALIGGTLYYSAVRRCNIADSTNTALEGLIATGAAAIVVEGTETASQWEHARNDARDRQDRSQANSLWRMFYQAKRQYSNDLSRESAYEYKVDRG